MPDLILGLYGGRPPIEPDSVDQCLNCGSDLYVGDEVVELVKDGYRYCNELCAKADHAKEERLHGESLPVPQMRKITLSAPEPDWDANDDL